MKTASFLVAVFAFCLLINASQVQSLNRVNLESVIKPGTLMASIRDSVGNVLINPKINVGGVKDAKTCRKNDGFNKKLFNANRKLYVSNPNAADNGWTLTMSPKNGASSVWFNSNGDAIDINDNSSSGCKDGDGDGVAGLFSLDLASTNISADCKSCSTNQISKGATKQNWSGSPQMTLINASAASDDLGRWAIEGVDINQTVPKDQPGGNYLLNVEFTVTAS